MTKIEFLEEQISNIERKIIKELEGEYAEKGLERSLADWTMNKLRGYFFMKSELEDELEYEVEEGQYKGED